MSKIKDLDIALKDTLNAHPEFVSILPEIICQNVEHGLIEKRFTRQNMARTRVQELKSEDFIEYVIHNAMLIYFAKDEIMKDAYSKNILYPNNNQVVEEAIMFPSFFNIEKSLPIITNANINVFLYYMNHQNELFYLADAVSKTRFNQMWYQNGVNNQGEEFRDKLERYGNSLAQNVFDKIEHDYKVIKPISNININYTAMNRCLREIGTGNQVKYNHNEYTLDGTLFATQDVGKRNNQEDSVLIMTHPDNDDFKFIAVSDGMGGHQAGEVASNYVINEISNWFMNIPGACYNNDFVELKKAFQDELQKISSSLCAKFNNYSHVTGGATFVGAIKCQDKTLVLNVGDSRAYIVNNNSINLVTQDDSPSFAMMVSSKNGNITNEDIDNLRFNPTNHRIAKCMGLNDLGNIQSTEINNDAYDKLLLFSDGVTDLLSMDEIKVIANTTKREYITRAIVEQALSKDAVDKYGNVIHAGVDNTTAAMISRR